MGDLTFFDLPPPATTATPAQAAAPEPAAGPSVVPRLPRRVHFCDMLPSPHVWLPPAADAATATPEGDTQEADEPVMGDEDKMDLLWEDFNEELLAMRRAGLHYHELPAESSSSDGEDDSADPVARRAPIGCFPVLRPAARAGLAAGHYRYRRRADTSWVLLMRIFRRLFVVDKTITSSSSSSAARHATASSSSKRR